ncbi:MAG: diheme cytochrome c [Ghiorsea sp.]|nr:diheme cytochrome c [Ghiorsea sp.]
MCFFLGLSLSSIAWGSDDSSSDDSGSHDRDTVRSLPVNVAFMKECSACHFAYPARFLPARSWTIMMNNLDEHFGENAELDLQVKQEIESYLVTHANKRMARQANQLSEKDVPLAITELRWFTKEHRGIPRKLIRGNPQVKSLSNCVACHTGAEQGSFGERGIRIPNYGRWED